MSENSIVPVIENRALLRPVAKPAEMMEAHGLAAEMIRETLDDGRDFGIIPGTGDKKVLLKPGAERLMIGFGLRAEYDVIENEKDHDRLNPFEITKWVKATDPGKAEKERLKGLGLGRNKKYGNDWQWQVPNIEAGESRGLYRYVIRARLIGPDGQEVGQGVGSCSSLESKYIRAPRDAENTILKMAKKRAVIDAVLSTLGLSDRFTQDVEEIQENRSGRGYDEPSDAEFTEIPDEGIPWLISMKFTPSEVDAFRKDCEAMGYEFMEVATGARAAGVTNGQTLVAYVTNLPVKEPAAA